MWSSFICVLFAIIIDGSIAQFPPRLNIPGALPVPDNSRSLQLRQQRLQAQDFVPRPRRPIAAPPREIRPVIEDEQDNYPPSQPSQSFSSFDNEVNKLSIPALASAVRQAADDEEPTLRPSPLPFRPEKPIPVLRDQIREKQFEAPAARPAPLPVARSQQQIRPAALPRPIRPIVRQELDADDEDRQPVRQKARPQPTQQFRPAPALRPAPRPQYSDDDELNRKRKPVVQILRKYRTDNPDGSITWGFENEDGTFKEETLGVDCTIKGKYGYVDPEGVKREFEYEAGNKCDPRQAELDELEDEEDLPQQAPKIVPKKPTNAGKPQFQYRPQLAN